MCEGGRDGYRDRERERVRGREKGVKGGSKGEMEGTHIILSEWVPHYSAQSVYEVWWFMGLLGCLENWKTRLSMYFLLKTWLLKPQQPPATTRSQLLQTGKWTYSSELQSKVCHAVDAAFDGLGVHRV